MSTLSERIAEAFSDLPREKRVKSRLAKACKISPASVNDWFSGKTLNLEAHSLLYASNYLGVSPFWLLDGTGSKLPTGQAQGGTPEWPFSDISPTQYFKLSKKHRDKIEGMVELKMNQIFGDIASTEDPASDRDFSPSKMAS